MLLHVTEELYEDDPENDPYDGGDASKIGFTAASIALLCRQLSVPIHIKWEVAKLRVIPLNGLNMKRWRCTSGGTTCTLWRTLQSRGR